MGDAVGDQILAEVDARLQDTAEGGPGAGAAAGNGQAAIGQGQRPVNLLEADVFANAQDGQLVAVDARRRAAPGHARIGDADGHFAAAGVVPVGVAAHRRAIDGGPGPADGVLNPEVEVGVIAKAAVPDGGVETAVFIRLQHRQFIAAQPVKEPVEVAQEGQQQRHVVKQRLAHNGNGLGREVGAEGQRNLGQCSSLLKGLIHDRPGCWRVGLWIESYSLCRVDT